MEIENVPIQELRKTPFKDPFVEADPFDMIPTRDHVFAQSNENFDFN
jgi:hypothetical protein